MSKRDFYEVLGVARHAPEAESEDCLSEAGAAAPPGSQSGRQGRGREVQGSGRGVRGALGSAEARRLRPLRPRRPERRPAAGFDPSTFVGFEDILGGLGDVFGFGDLFGGGRRRGGPQQGSASALRPRDRFEEAARGTETSIQFPRAESCETCQGTGAAAGSGPTRARLQRPRPAALPAGLFHRRADVRSVPRHRPGHRQAVPACHGEGRATKERKLTVKIPAGIATGQRLRLHGEGEHGVQGGPPGDLYVVIQVQDHAFFRRDGNDLLLRHPVHFPTLALGGEMRWRRCSASPSRSRFPKARPRARRSVCAARACPTSRAAETATCWLRSTRGAEEADEGTAPAARAARRFAAAGEVRAAPHGETHDDQNIFERVKDIFG